jgi:hypothetical protein
MPDSKPQRKATRTKAAKAPAKRKATTTAKRKATKAPAKRKAAKAPAKRKATTAKRKPATAKRKSPATKRKASAAGKSKSSATAKRKTSTAKRKPAKRKAASKAGGKASALAGGGGPPSSARATRRPAGLPRDVLRSFEDGQKTALEAVRRFADTVEEAIPNRAGAPPRGQEVIDSALEMAERLVQAQYDLVRKVAQSAGRALGDSVKRN